MLMFPTLRSSSATAVASRRLAQLRRAAVLLGVASTTLNCGDDRPQTFGPPGQTSVTTDSTPSSSSVANPTTSPSTESSPTTTSSTVPSSATPSTSDSPTTAPPAPIPSSEAADSSGSAITSESTSSSETSSNPDTESTPTAVDSTPSPGCGGGSNDAAVPSAVVDTPDGYDGVTPVPVLFAFHGAGGSSSSLQGPFARDAKERGYLGVYLKSSGNEWSRQADTPVLDAAYAAVVQNYCVDINRVFAVGHSSGAQMITQLLCANEDRFRAVAPVASSKYCNGWDATAAIVIHGVDDIERGGQGENRYGLDDGNGHKDFAVYHDSNQCTEAATPFDPGGNCGADIDPGCVEYDDCAARTVFCNHNDPQYGTSNHGVPCFASKVMFDFFDEFE